MSNIDFKQTLKDAGIPTTQAELTREFEQEVKAQGSPLTNTSSYSPFWRIVLNLVSKPVLWLIDFTSDTVLPNFFVQTATGAWLDMLAWAVEVERKEATTAKGKILFTRENPSGSLEIPAGTRVQSTPINGHVYELITTEPQTFNEGDLQLFVNVEAVNSGSAYNLAPGYYAILPEPIAGIVQVANLENWLTSPGDDTEPDEQLRLRIRNQFSAVNQYHTDAVYRKMITSFAGVQADGVYFEHGAPRGPGSANAYVLFEAGVPADSYLAEINSYIRDQGNHGHGDDMLVFKMPEIPIGITVDIWPFANISEEQKETLYKNIELFIRAAFRESTTADYTPTRTYPQSRFSFSRLTEEIHEQFKELESLNFHEDDIINELNIPVIETLTVIKHD